MVMTLMAILINTEKTVSAFHSGGVGPCDACHVMHGTSGSGSALLRGSDPSSTCLHCHERPGSIGPSGHHISTPASDMQQGMPPRQLTPGGDFGWLRKIYIWVPDVSQAPATSYGDQHGHNIVAADYSYLPDALHAAAPRGTYPSASLTCISCHDPHGRYRRNIDGTTMTNGNPIGSSGSYVSSADPQSITSVGVYRLLGGKNYQPRSVAGNLAFLNDPPVAVAPDEYNRSEAASQTRVAYGTGMSEWCQNCHPGMHPVAGSGAPRTHPVGITGRIGSAVANAYNSYVRTGDLTGSAATSFLSLVPFEEGVSDIASLKAHAGTDGSFAAGPDPVSSQVMCLTCHRAHASGWNEALRWNTRTEYIVYNGLYSQEAQAYQPYGQGRTELEAQKAYYDIPSGTFAVNQDSLCHKCHTGALP
ncbi:MAG: cytochrome C [Nitrospirota bacterium]